MTTREVYTGYWVDQTKGPILGGTLTYSSSWGSQLITGATILVQIMGSAFWLVVAFCIHQWMTRDETRDEFQAQRLVLLRNSSPASNILGLFEMGQAWHKRIPHAWRRALGNMIIPFVIYTGFIVAGVLVGQITMTTGQSRALIKQNTCGFVNISTTEILNADYIIDNSSIAANTYARDCYAQSTANAVACSAYVQSTLKYHTIQNAPCPIGAGNCKLGDNKAITFATTMLDSHNDFGINAKPQDRLTYQYNVTCAPANHDLLKAVTTNDTTSLNLRDDANTYPILRSRFGVYNNVSTGFDGVVTPYNYSTVLAAYGATMVGYSVSPYISLAPHNGTSGFIPFAPFNQSGIDMTIIMIAPNSIKYSGPSTDGIFGTLNHSNAAGNYAPAEYFNALTCSEIYEICSPSNCTGPLPMQDLYDAWYTFPLNSAQNATYQRMVWNAGLSNMFFASLIPSPLLASDYVIRSSVSVQLKNQQWMREAELMFQSVLAKLQYMFAEYPNMPTGELSAQNISITPPDHSMLQTQCGQQMIQTPAGYESYNVFALVFIFVMSILTICAALFVQQYHHVLPRRKVGQRHHVKMLGWQADGMLQIHRVAMEGRGYGGWVDEKSGHEEVPYTEVGSKRIPPPSMDFRNDDRVSKGQMTDRVMTEHSIEKDDSSSPREKHERNSSDDTLAE